MAARTAKETKQGEGEEKAGRGAQGKSLATDRTRAHELDRRLSLRPCARRRHLSRLLSAPSDSAHAGLVDILPCGSPIVTSGMIPAGGGAEPSYVRIEGEYNFRTLYLGHARTGRAVVTGI